MLRFFVSEIQKCFTCMIFISYVFVQAKSAGKQRFVGLSGCDRSSALEYQCCATVNLASTPQSQYCVDIQLVPNELAVNIALKLDGETFYNGKLDPSIAPICPPPSPLCIAVNHVNLLSREICTKLTIGPLTLVKFPCISVTDGQIVVLSNDYVRK